ncbi:FAS1 domain-containing protein [Amylocystis lapponica]|nr:FAS1 domain-containing protein [Amylocystis lapponica]
MRFALLPFTLLATVSSVVAQTQNTTFLEGLAATLSNAGLTSLVSLVGQANSSAVGQFLLATISSGKPYTLFAPNNDACQYRLPARINAPASVNESLTDTLGYHIVSGNFSTSHTTYPNVTLGRTFLNDTIYVQLEGSKDQVVAWAVRSDGKTHVLNQANDSTVVNTTTYGNLTIQIVDAVLTYPQNFASTVSMDNSSLTSLQSVLQGVSVSYYNASTSQTSDSTAYNIINSGFHGFTLFAPNSSALDAVQSSLAGLSSNQSLVETLLLNHMINGTSVYSPQLVGQNFTSAAGEALTFSINSTGQYVTSGNVTALIIQPDVLLSNGVVHIIDQVFLNTQSDTGAASSAAASATSAAGQSTTETQPIGFSQTASLNPSGSGSGSNSASTSKSAAAMRFSGPGGLQVLTIGIAIVGVLVGSLVILV